MANIVKSPIITTASPTTRMPRDELMESLRKNHEKYQALPEWIRSSVPAQLIFAIPHEDK